MMDAQEHKIGDVHQAAWWFAPGRKAQAKDILRRAFKRDAEAHGLRFGQILWEVQRPGDPGCPPVPTRFRHIGGLKLLRASARIVRLSLRASFADLTADEDGNILDRRPKGNGTIPIRSFFDDLEPKDQERMIRVTQQEYAKLNPGKPPLSTERCIEYIEQVAPGIWEKELKAAVDAGRV